ncbi:hypothetical protein CCUS01_03865 [Colletotrichum cuscutae]|uniref:Heterokaryon incompatibility domain-containing protein n=1 Tax=Colletotrichum cuscutae TaxID=1209917 RepID=A0AAI9VGQ3_9PEZI|nr:hypothetical protein CCUS01_03865 [Colletotrichum cuscutae]
MRLINVNTGLLEVFNDAKSRPQYAILSHTWGEEEDDVPCRDDPNWITKLRESRWFTRGWTLQELLEPSELTFYSENWRSLGSKRQLSSAIVEITGIPRPIFVGATKIREASVAQRMSWAAKR